jgi:choice-of-anchor B domain-containing protein
MFKINPTMKIDFSLVILLLLFFQTGFSQSTLNTTQLGHLSYTKSLNDVRGAAYNGREYALVGVRDGLSIVDVTDPTAPTEVFFGPGPSSTWRDPFFHNGHAYCVTEGGGGMLIVDMSPLPTTAPLPTTLYTGSTFEFESAHNMFIDTDNDKAYIFGTDNIDGAIILDISNPMSPVELGVWNDFYIHDGFIRGDTMWAACLEEGVFVVDISNPSNPITLANWDTPSEFAHNVWPSDDNAYCYTTDEVTSGFVAAYDMSNLQNVVETDKARHPLSDGAAPHNAHFFNDYIVTSHYRDGLTVHDASDPSNIVLTGYFDSSPASGNGFNGAWGAWPYLPSGNILVSDIEEGLFILGVDYVRAAKLEGTVTEFGSGNLLNGVQIEVVGSGLNELTNLFGDYATGTATAATYDVTFQKGGYISQTITGVVLTNGQTEILDVELKPQASFILSGTVTELGTGTPIEGATLVFENEFFTKQFTTNSDGIYTDNNFFEGNYDVTIDAWGYVGQCSTVSASASATPPNFELEVGYEDNFVLDLGWTVNGNAGAGTWERGIPVGTTFDGQFSNPGSDAGSNCGERAYVTGNGGGNAGSDDVDDGVTALVSPIMDLTTYVNPTIQFDYWFFNDGGNNTPNDSFVAKVDNGSDTITLGTLVLSNSQWVAFSAPLTGQVAITSTMHLIIEVADNDPGHLVEGGLDNFRIAHSTGISSNTNDISISLFPNPAIETVNILVGTLVKNGSVQLYDLSGKAVGNSQELTQGLNVISTPKVPGVYLCEILINGHRKAERLLIHR